VRLVGGVGERSRSWEFSYSTKSGRAVRGKEEMCSNRRGVNKYVLVTDSRLKRSRRLRKRK
jgi:hypothetical protein